MKLPLITAAIATALLAAGAASAQTPMAPAHARRAEVNHRLMNQDQRIDHKLRTGQISPARARELHRQDHAIRHRERVIASRHNGHISRAAQARLNQRENAVSRQIGR
jgi:hypothetical protein